jgi:hypothetical protein
VNVNAFENAEKNPEAAYWLGFLMADGCVHDTSAGFSISCCLKHTDVDHLHKLEKFIQTGGRIGIYKRGNFGDYSKSDYAKITLYSKHLVDSVLRYGLVPRKTFDCKVAVLENDRHFWRGMIDGDGSVGWHRKGEYRKPTVSLVGTRGLMIQFMEFCAGVTNVRASVVQHKNIWSFRLVSGAAYEIIRHLYADAPVTLERKWLVAEEIINAGPPARKKLVRVKKAGPRVYSWLTPEMIAEAVSKTDSLRTAAKSVCVPWSAFYTAYKKYKNGEWTYGIA